jgi:FdhD protein
MEEARNNSGIKEAEVIRFRDAHLLSDNDMLAVEEPMEIRISYGHLTGRKTQSISVTMRTPGDDVELALGFLFTEGIIQSPEQIMHADHIAYAKTTESRNNIVHVSLREDVDIELEKLKRNFYTTSSCGVCGKESIDAIKMECPVYQRTEFEIASDMILKLPDTLRQQQSVFSSTGGIHAAAFFNIDGELLLLREDVGRHNALDKLIGASLFAQQNINPLKSVLLLSGRASFELIQKAAMAGVSIVCAVGAPSSLAVQMAKDFKITLIGFLRENRFNIYSEGERVSIKK